MWDGLRSRIKPTGCVPCSNCWCDVSRAADDFVSAVVFDNMVRTVRSGMRAAWATIKKGTNV